MGKTLEELFKDNGSKFPFSVKMSKDSHDKNWWNDHYKHKAFFTFVKETETEFVFDKPQYSLLEKVPNVTGIVKDSRILWELVEEKRGTLQSFLKQGIYPPYTVEIKTNTKDFLEVYSYDGENFHGFDLKENKRICWSGYVCNVKLLQGEE